MDAYPLIPPLKESCYLPDRIENTFMIIGDER
jgi:hypothetical protein